MGTDTGAPGPSRRGKKVPQESLKHAEQLALKWWEHTKGAATPAESFARFLGRSPNSSLFDRDMGALRSFGLVIPDSDRKGWLVLSQVGRDLVQGFDPPLQTAARGRALLSNPQFAKVVRELAGGELPTSDSLVARMEHTFEIDRSKADRVAQALVESLTHAGFLADDGRVTLTAVDPPMASEAPTEARAMRTDLSEASASRDPSSAGNSIDEPVDEKRGSDQPNQPGRVVHGAPTSVSLHLHLPDLDGDAVLRVIAALGEAFGPR